MQTLTSPTPAALRQALADHPRQRARDLADSLGMPEAALLAAQVGHGAVRIAARPDRLIPAVQTLGEVMGLTRNDSCVHERVGCYETWHPGDHAAMVIGPEIDLRIFLRHWVHAFAVAGERPSLQVFDAAGDAVHKVYLREGSDRAAFDRLTAALALPEQTDRPPPSPHAPHPSLPGSAPTGPRRYARAGRG